MRKIALHPIAYVVFCITLCGCDRVNAPSEPPDLNTTPNSERQVREESRKQSNPPNNETEQKAPPSPPLVAAARSQIGKTVTYDPAYVGLSYPGGDVPIERGVCTDVVIRALRDAYGMDLQKLVHEDMKSNFNAYPKNWGLSRTDKNIDHRRVPNLRRYFERRSFKVSNRNAEYQPGDLVTCTVGNRPHIMIVSDRKSADGNPLVIHNIGRGTVEEDRLSHFPITGHYRVQR